MKTPIHHYYFSRKKRIFDIVVASLLLVFALPVFVLLYVLLKCLYGNEPVFFQQVRVGKDKQKFWLWKFRTMQIGAEKLRTRYKGLNTAPWPMYKIPNDPRFTQIGKVLSHLGIDELPQLWHVLEGKMSLVGPRPLPWNEARLLPSKWDFRYRVLPGMFSPWTLDPLRHHSAQHWLHVDRETLASGSVGQDTILLVRIVQFFFQKMRQMLR
jgi:lipopolysaccharide/colanic/teichoic acid biosynthesis glycosyltransferase